MPSNTKHDPQKKDEFQKGYLNKDAKGVAATCTAGTSTNIDLTLADDTLVSGGGLIVIGAAQGDTIDFQVVHPTYGVLATYIDDWYINPEVAQQVIPEVTYPAKLVTGLKLRAVYNSVGGTDVWVAINYDKEKVLE